MQLFQYFNASKNHRKPLLRLLMGLALLLLALQLISSERHNHAYAESDAGCSSCFFAHHVPSSLPPVTPALVPVLALTSYPLPAFVPHEYLTRRSYLIPHAQAPPAAASPF